MIYVLITADLICVIMMPPLGGKKFGLPRGSVAAKSFPRRNLNKNRIYFAVSGKRKMKASIPSSILPFLSRKVLNVFGLSYLKKK
jgi:hypothetical protein